MGSTSTARPNPPASYGSATWMLDSLFANMENSSDGLEKLFPLSWEIFSEPKIQWSFLSGSVSVMSSHNWLAGDNCSTVQGIGVSTLVQHHPQLTGFWPQETFSKLPIPQSFMVCLLSWHQACCIKKCWLQPWFSHGFPWLWWCETPMKSGAPSRLSSGPRRITSLCKCGGISRSLSATWRYKMRFQTLRSRSMKIVKGLQAQPQ